jgi:uncharacterized damage-inducible protein DinB
MITPDYARTFARYNRWMNERLLDACEALSDAARKEDRGAPFRSVHGTVNHLLLTDLLWLGRFRGEPFTVQSLGQELYADWGELREARRRTDDAIDAWVEGLDTEALTGTVSFTAVSRPVEYTLPMTLAVMHLFNHQTHHRGQLTVLMEQSGVDCGVTDLGAMPRP